MRCLNMPRMLKESSSGLVCLHGCSRVAVITITCLYTAGSSIRESPTSACQHINLHKCIYRATYICIYCNCLSRQHKQEADISAFQFNVELLWVGAHLLCCLYFIALITFQWESSFLDILKSYLKSSDFMFLYQNSQYKHNKIWTEGEKLELQYVFSTCSTLLSHIICKSPEPKRVHF